LAVGFGILAANFHRLSFQQMHGQGKGRTRVLCDERRGRFFMAAEQPSFFIKSALGSRSRMMATQNAALGLLSTQSRYGIKPGTTIVRIVDGAEEVVLADNALSIALMRWRTKNPSR
jgi:hypothetical protein